MNAFSLRSGAFSAASKTGTSSLQLALILPIFLLFLMGLVDIARYYWIKHSLNTAAELGVKMAIYRDELGIDLRGRSPDDLLFRTYQRARKEVLDAAIKRSLNSSLLSLPGTASMSDLLIMAQDDSALSGYLHALPLSESAAALVRPGEKAWVKLASGQWEEIISTDPILQMTKQANYADALKERPLLVELRAQMKPILVPFFDITVSGRASGRKRFTTPESLQLESALAKEGISTTSTTTTTSTSVTTSSATTTTIQCVKSWEQRIIDCAKKWKGCPDPVNCVNCVQCAGGM